LFPISELQICKHLKRHPSGLMLDPRGMHMPMKIFGCVARISSVFDPRKKWEGLGRPPWKKMSRCQVWWEHELVRAECTATVKCGGGANQQHSRGSLIIGRCCVVAVSEAISVVDTPALPTSAVLTHYHPNNISQPTCPLFVFV